MIKLATQMSIGTFPNIIYIAASALAAFTCFKATPQVKCGVPLWVPGLYFAAIAPMLFDLVKDVPKIGMDWRMACLLLLPLAPMLLTRIAVTTS